MSRENVEFVLRFVQPGPEVDFGRLFRDEEMWAMFTAVAASLCEPEFEILVRGLPGGDRRHSGVEGLRAVWLDWLRPWASYRAEVVKAVPVGERVLLLYHSFGRLEGSSVEISDELASVWTVRDKRVAAVEFHATSHAEARAAVGLE